MNRITQRTALALAVSTVAVSAAHAAPYASSVSVDGTSVSFVLNEPTDILQVSIPGSAPILLDGSSKGTKTFNLPSTGSAFSIYTRKVTSSGYSISNGGLAFADLNGLSQITTTADAVFLSDDSTPYRYNSPRGIDIGKNPNASNFGITYISNSAAATTAEPNVRNLQKGIYAQKADGTDAFGYGDTAQSVPIWTSTTTANSPFRVTVGPDGNVYVVGFGDAASGVWRMSPNLTTTNQLFVGETGPSDVPPEQNHGSITASHIEGNFGSNLTVYTLDEDMAGNRYGAGPAGLNNLWRYNLGAATGPVADAPTRINQESQLLNLATSDLARGKDGKFYLFQNRSAGNEAGITVLDADGAKLYDSLTASRELIGAQDIPDIVRNIMGAAVSPDQRFIALMLNNSDVAVIPLVDGIPDLANRLLVDTGPNVNSGRDITFDAAGNIHYVSSGQGFYRILSPGGFQQSLLTFNGTSFSFSATLPGDYNGDGFVDAADYTVWADNFGQSGAGLLGDGNDDGFVDAADYTVWADNFGAGRAGGAAVSVPEPASMGLLGAGALALLARRRRA